MREVLFRVAAVLIGLAPFVLVELLLSAFDRGRPEWSDDPFVGFSSVRPLFVLDAARARYETSPARRTHFVPVSFDAAKGPDEFRIFVLGGSTVQGNPYSIPTAFTTWLELSLESADPSRKWQVVNCGGISYASYRLVPIMQEILAYAPDMFIVYTGQNEFLEDRTYGDIKRTPQLVACTHHLVSRLRTYNVLRAGYVKLANTGTSPPQSKDRASLQAEVEALLDYRGGMERYHRDESWRRAVIAHYEFNLRRMVEISRRARVRLVLINPVCNLRDSPPFKSEHGAGLDSNELAQWESLWSTARGLYDGRYRQAAALLEQAIAIDDQHAGIHYDLAKCYEAMGHISEARDQFVLAKELDICPLRILEPMHECVIEVARQSRTPLVDARQLFERLSPTGIPGHEWLVDHVHPSIRGHQVLAGELADEMVRLGIVRPVPDWHEIRDRRFAEHLGSLDAIYFIRGQQHLEGLTRWAEGRILKERPQSPDHR